MSYRVSRRKLRAPGWRLAVVVSVVIVGGSLTAIVSGQIGGSERRLPQLTEEQAREDLPAIFNGGDPVAFETVVVPVDAGDLTIFGPFRLIPWGFVGDLPYEFRGLPKGGVQTTDLDVLRTSSLYRDVDTLLPQGTEWLGADTGIETSEDVVHAVYEHPDTLGRIEIWSIRPTTVPYGIDLPQDGSWSTREVDGLHVAIVNHIPDTLDTASGFTRVQVFVSDGDVVGLVESDYYAQESLLPIALAMFEEGRG